MQYSWGFWKDALERENSLISKAHIWVKGRVVRGHSLEVDGHFSSKQISRDTKVSLEILNNCFWLDKHALFKKAAGGLW